MDHQRSLSTVLFVALGLALGGCKVGPDYQRPAIELPTSFKEGTHWQRAVANPQGALNSQWWLAYQGLYAGIPEISVSPAPVPPRAHPGR